MTPNNKELDTSDLTKNQQPSAAWKNILIPKCTKTWKNTVTYWWLMRVKQDCWWCWVPSITILSGILTMNSSLILEKCTNVKIHYLALTLTLHSWIKSM
jgi:hypothetical protein